MPMPFLGKNHLYWCNNCNIPILEKNKCNICNSSTEKVPITTPYDVRPAFEKDLELIRRTIDNQFGNGLGPKIIEDNKIILLNKAPYFDRMDEIILDGKILGTIRYNIERAQPKWEFIPRIEGAKRLAKFGCKKWVKVDEDAVKFIRQAANVLAPGVLDNDNSIEYDEYVIVINPNSEAIGIGVSRATGKEIPNKKKGMVVKTKRGIQDSTLNILPSGQTWDLVIEANSTVLENKEKHAMNLIKNVVKRYDLPKLVSFSGGKDSICTLMLVLESGIDFKVFYLDTGIEFEESLNFVNEIIRDFKLKDSFIMCKTDADFFENIETRGVPAKDYRWCNRLLKLNVIIHMIQNNFPDGIVTFVGSRKYESFSRYQDSIKGHIVKSKLIDKQINVNLIINWTALHVWLYIFSKKVKFNPLYKLGYERIGCMYCPANKLADLEILKEIHPKIYEKWHKILENQAKKLNYPQEWITKGFWRYHNKEKWRLNTQY